MNTDVDFYFKKAKKWQEEMSKLRTILLGCPVTEELKWGKPCYTFQDSNIVLIVGFKEHCALIFAKGALLKDPQGILIQPTENSQEARLMRFTSMAQIVKLESVVKSYVHEAVEVQKAGLKVVFKKTSEFKIPDEFKTRLAGNPALKKAFEALTPGRQRGYLLYFSGAKQSKTREARVEKSTPQILAGKGLND